MKTSITYLLLLALQIAFTNALTWEFSAKNIYSGTTIPLSTINIENKISFELLEIPEEFTNNNELDWCLSLKTDDEKKFNCFVFLDKLNFRSSKITGILSFIIDENKLITDVTYFKNNKELSLKISKPYEIPYPQLAFNSQVGAPLTTQVEIDDEEEFDEFDELPGENTNVENTDNNDDDEFQEIVRPNRLYSGNKTFIEQYWMYIIPPILLFMAMSTFGKSDPSASQLGN